MTPRLQLHSWTDSLPLAALNRIGWFAGALQTIHMHDVSADTMRLLLDHVYGATRPRLGFDEAVAMFKMSDKYGMAGLHQQCTRVLTLMVTSETVSHLQHLADSHHCSPLFEVSAKMCKCCCCSEALRCGTET